MPWIANYLLLPLLMNHLTAFGRGILGVGEAIRKLIPDKVTERDGLQGQLKVIPTARAYIRIMHCNI